MCCCEHQITSLILLSPQTGGWSALHFSAENGDSATTYALIKAGANVHLKDKVWDSHKFSFLQTLFSLSLYRMGGQLWRLLKSSQQMKRLQSFLSGLMTTWVTAMKE